MDNLVPVTDITDLNMECLLTVFHYLDVTELANLAEANITSNWKLGKQKRISEINRYKKSIVKAFKIKVRINEWKTFVHTDARCAPKDIKMLRSFGREVEALLIDYSDYNANRRYEKALEDAIITNCCKTLTNVDFYQCKKDSMNELEQPFINVELVEFRYSHLGNTLGQLKKWFPNMEDLRFTETYVFDSKCIHEHFPCLESLLVWNDEWQGSAKEKMIFTNSNLKAFFHLNPQLEELNIRHDNVDESKSGDNAIIVDWDLLTFINKNLKLKRLKLNLENFRFDREWQSMVTIQSLIALDVECANFDCLEKIKITSAKLTDLNLKIESGYERDKQFNYEAIATFVIGAKPERLKIEVEYNCNTFAVDNVQFLNMTRMLPKLQEIFIELLWNDNIPDAVMNLLVNSTTLKKLVGEFKFNSDDKGEPCSKYLQMRQVFREKIVRKSVVARRWTHKFCYKDDYIDSIQFERIE